MRTAPRDGGSTVAKAPWDVIKDIELKDPAPRTRKNPGTYIERQLRHISGFDLYLIHCTHGYQPDCDICQILGQYSPLRDALTDD